jgi:hypothetical protein
MMMLMGNGSMDGLFDGFCDDGDDEDCNIFDGLQDEDDESEDDDEEVIVKKKPVKKAAKKTVKKGR